MKYVNKVIREAALAKVLGIGKKCSECDIIIAHESSDKCKKHSKNK